MDKILLPPTLQDLSIKTIFGAENKAALDQIKQLSMKEIIGAAVLIKIKEVNLVKYESVLDLEIDDRSADYRNKLSYHDCNVDELCYLSEWNSSVNDVIKLHHLFSEYSATEHSHIYNNPMYDVIYNKNSTNIIKNYHEKRDEILSLPDMPSSVATINDSIRDEDYHDPLYFKQGTYPKNNNSISNTLIFINNNISSATKALEKSMSILEEKFFQSNKQAYILAKTSSMELNHYLLVLKESLIKRDDLCDEYINFFCSIKEKEMSIIRSLEIIMLMRKVDSKFRGLKNISYIMKSINFMTMEDRIESLKSRISSNSKTEHDKIRLLTSSLSLTSYLLKRKYHNLITRKKARIKNLLEKINLSEEYKSDENFLAPTFIESMNMLLKKISLSREPKSDKRDKELLNHDLDKASYILKKISPDNEDRTDQNLIEPVFIENILESVKKMRTEIKEMEMTLSTLD
ncbi:putative coiled coil protein [Candidatus Ichthyocystis hellenicum]|uniref:Putative coiled coil protein n=1 Tax=Candidatus Ichthyocystis hellenicum TaxID=1561003 RepID=A0A0S4M6T8_9BURK|nr:hypothetical protein [Candidatus Ichthyocystis hellenicum]CUT17108.1 putative coiled coil protein [Candidatus Ichthyocystis hellenicum]